MAISLVGTTADKKTMIDYTDALKSAELTTSRLDSPAKLTFEGVETEGIAMPEGTAVTFGDHGQRVFAGYVFSAERDRYGVVKYTAYDQTRYLKAKASYSFVNMSLEQIIQQIAADFGLKIGPMMPTGYIFPSLIYEDKSCLDMIFDALTQVIYQTGKIFNFYDDHGGLVLAEASAMKSNLIIGDGSLMTNYSYKRSIDSDSYNRIKLARPNKETGRTDVFVHEDTENQKKWGLLQFYKKVDENLNDAQIDQLCAAYLTYYNKVDQSLKLESMGQTGLRAGMMIPVLIEDIADLSFNRLLLCEKVTHKYEGSGAHTMSIELKNFEQLGGAAAVV